MRTAAAVIVGYLFFAAASFVLFAVTGQEPHETVGLAFALVATVYGVVAAFIAGLLAVAIARRLDQRPSILVAGIIVVVALISMLTVPAGGSRWSMVAAMLLMAPSALAGGWFYRRLVRSTTSQRQSA